MSHNNQKKTAVINDLSGFGRCSLTVSIPILSAMRIQCCPLPTSIFSNHTGFPSHFMTDFTDKMEPYFTEWKKLGLQFDGIASGFLGSADQIEIVQKFLKEFRTEKTVILIDPVMGDYGKAYQTYTEELCQRMKALVSYADILTPNVTEACILTDTPYQENWKQGELVQMAEQLLEQGPDKVVITGIVCGTYLGNLRKGKSASDASDKENRKRAFRHRRCVCFDSVGRCGEWCAAGGFCEKGIEVYQSMHQAVGGVGHSHDRRSLF